MAVSWDGHSKRAKAERVSGTKVNFEDALVSGEISFSGKE